MSWNRNNFYDFIVENNVIGFFNKPIELKSGRSSYFYVNWRDISEDVSLIDKLSDYVINFVRNLKLKPDTFFGVAEGATKLGVITQYKWAKIQPDYNSNAYSLSMGRGKPKDHGATKDKFFLGIPKGKTIILEDVTTTGSSLIETIDEFKDLNVNVIAAIGLTNRNELRDDKKTVEQAIQEREVNYYSMSDAIDILPKIFKIINPGKEIALQIEDYFDKYGIKKIKLL